jgi:nucleoid DNA-binding protein
MAKTQSNASSKARTKTELLNALAESTGLTKKDVSSVFEALSGEIKKDLGRRGPGVMTIPGLLKLKVVRKPATKARKGINPFTGEETVFKAKPARNVVKAQPLKALKEMV